MSLICVKCNRPIVVSLNPTHYGVCSKCDPTDLTPEQAKKIRQGIQIKKEDNRK